MQCKHCGGNMEGDGFTIALHCETLDITGEGYEPDSSPIYCTPNTYEGTQQALLRDKRIALNTLTVELHAVEAAMTIVLSFLFGEREIENPQYLESCHYQLQKIATYLETEMTKTRTELQNTNPEA